MIISIEIYNSIDIIQIIKEREVIILDRFFKLKERNTNVRQEIIAGITTFLAMAYILAVNPAMLQIGGLPYDGVFLATAISAGFASIVMGIVGHYPVALAPGMGANALFTYTVILTYGFSPAAALAAVFVSGMIFILISVTGIRNMIIQSIPTQLKLAIGAGIGFFIAFIGLVNAGIVVANDATLVGIGDFTNPTVLLSIFGIILTLILMSKKINGSVFLGLVITAIVGVILGFFGIAGMPEAPSQIISFKLDTSIIGLCFSGFGELFSNPNTPIAVFSILFLDFFDTTGTLISIANRIGFVNEKGELKDIEKALLSDSIGSVFGAFMGTSTVTSYVESTAGVGAGGRTGLTAVVTGIMFFLSIIFAPILSVFTNYITAPALVVVGVLMAEQLAGIEWDDFTVAASAFFVIITMILHYSISNGIAIGFIVYALLKTFTGKWKEITPTVWVLVALFIFYFTI